MAETASAAFIKPLIYIVFLLILLPTLISAHIPTPLWIILIIAGLMWLLKK